MTRSLTQIKKQIAALEAQAEAIKKKEAGGVIARIKEAIAHYGLTASDLGEKQSAFRQTYCQPCQSVIAG